MPLQFSTLAIWLIGITVIALILLRPRRIPEYVWATAGALLLVLSHLIPWRQAATSVRAGSNVYWFLAGMMLLAEVARRHGVFDWLAALAMEHARGSRLRLFVLIYVVGIVVTALLSNDTTAVVLTPAVLAVVDRAKDGRGRVSPMPYLFACALVANAASFLLPISNPANLVVFPAYLPSLGHWLLQFFLPSVTAIGVTFGLLWWHQRKDLVGTIDDGIAPAPLTPQGKRAAIGILFTAVILLITSACGLRLGLPTCAVALLVLVAANAPNFRDVWASVRHVSWGVLLLVAGLFVLVGALNQAGALPLSVAALQACARWPALAGAVSAAFGAGFAANVLNNLPVGLIGASALQAAHASRLLHGAVLLGIDLGPNLSVTGSLATILWLIALRRENINVSAGQFLRVGLCVMPPVLLLSVLALMLGPR